MKGIKIKLTTKAKTRDKAIAINVRKAEKIKSVILLIKTISLVLLYNKLKKRGRSMIRYG